MVGVQGIKQHPPEKALPAFAIGHGETLGLAPARQRNAAPRPAPRTAEIPVQATSPAPEPEPAPEPATIENPEPVLRAADEDRTPEPAPVEPEPERPAPIPTPVVRAEFDRAGEERPRPALRAEAGSRISEDEYESRVDRLVDREEVSPFRRIMDRARGEGPAPESSSPRPASGPPSRKDLEEPSFLRRLRD